MDFFSYLENLRHKPAPERRQAAITITILIVLCLGILWLVLGYVRAHTGIPKDAPREVGGIVAPY